jgi:hypothetical protein
MLTINKSIYRNMHLAIPLPHFSLTIFIEKASLLFQKGEAGAKRVNRITIT